jgi:predicted RNA-binding protein with PUA-like domain
LFWILKTEPTVWSWQQQLIKNFTTWDDIRNYQARNYLRTMNIGDLCFFYHTEKERSIVGIVEIVKTAYNDPLDDNFSVVDVQTKISLNNPVPLSTIKATEELKNLAMLKQPRLSVSPINQEEFNKIIELSNTSFTL